MQRRELLAQFISLTALAPVAAGQHCAVERIGTPYTLRFFTPAEHKALAELMELIIPTDDHSPGAREARTADFADWMVFHSSVETQKVWREGLRTLTPESLPAAAAREDVFFLRLKLMTVDGYYTSEIGIEKDLGYRGNQYLTKYEGCTHPEHQG